MYNNVYTWTYRKNSILFVIAVAMAILELTQTLGCTLVKLEHDKIECTIDWQKRVIELLKCFYK